MDLTRWAKPGGRGHHIVMPLQRHATHNIPDREMISPIRFRSDCVPHQCLPNAAGHCYSWARRAPCEQLLPDEKAHRPDCDQDFLSSAESPRHLRPHVSGSAAGSGIFQDAFCERPRAAMRDRRPPSAADHSPNGRSRRFLGSQSGLDTPVGLAKARSICYEAQGDVSLVGMAARKTMEGRADGALQQGRGTR